mgnify:CR=1 FL=1
MIKNLWKEVNFYCSYRHEYPVKMEFNQGPHSLFYSCPKYYPQNRTADEPACPMRLNLVDAEAIVEKLSQVIESDIENNVEHNYRGYEFDYKMIHAKVIKYAPGEINIDIFNKKAIR